MRRARIAAIVGPAVRGRRARPSCSRSPRRCGSGWPWAASPALLDLPAPSARRLHRRGPVPVPLRRAHARAPSRCSCSRSGFRSLLAAVVLLVVVRRCSSSSTRWSCGRAWRRARSHIGLAVPWVVALLGYSVYGDRRRGLRRGLRRVRPGRPRPARGGQPRRGGRGLTQAVTAARHRAKLARTKGRSAALVDREQRLGQQLDPVDERRRCRPARGSWRRTPGGPAPCAGADRASRCA